MSCGHLALERARIPVTNYFASEIEKHAIKVTQANYPDTIQLGDVRQVKGSNLPKIDLLLGGSPCQGFSFAGKQLNFEDERSKLFFEFVRLLNEVKPKWFLLENVVMKEEYSKVITKMLGVGPVRLNSALVCAQNRDRLYWTNIPNFWPPSDRGIMLRDIIHENTDGVNIDKYKVSPTKAFRLLDAEVNRRKVALIHEKDTQSSRVYSIHGKAICLSGAGGGGAVNMGQYLIQEPHGASQGGIIDSDKAPALTESGYEHKTMLLSAEHFDEGPCFAVAGVDRGDKFQSRQRINSGEKSFTLTAQDRHGLLTSCYIRKLSPTECERLQTVPDGYTDHVSETQRYRMLGNGWTIDIIEHLLRDLSETSMDQAA